MMAVNEISWRSKVKSYFSQELKEADEGDRLYSYLMKHSTAHKSFKDVKEMVISLLFKSEEFKLVSEISKEALKNASYTENLSVDIMYLFSR